MQEKFDDWTSLARNDLLSQNNLLKLQLRGLITELQRSSEAGMTHVQAFVEEKVRRIAVERENRIMRLDYTHANHERFTSLLTAFEDSFRSEAFSFFESEIASFRSYFDEEIRHLVLADQKQAVSSLSHQLYVQKSAESHLLASMRVLEAVLFHAYTF